MSLFFTSFQAVVTG